MKTLKYLAGSLVVRWTLGVVLGLFGLWVLGNGLQYVPVGLGLSLAGQTLITWAVVSLFA